jgi:hypothetical protein
MHIAKLTNAGAAAPGTSFFINLDLVEAIFPPTKFEATQIRMSSDVSYFVKETPEEIAAMALHRASDVRRPRSRGRRTARPASSARATTSLPPFPSGKKPLLGPYGSPAGPFLCGPHHQGAKHAPTREIPEKE